MMPSLRRVLLDIVSASLPVALLGCGLYGSDELLLDAREEYSGGCYPNQTHDVTLPEPPRSDLEPLVRACEANANDCWSLCNAILDDLSREAYQSGEVVTCDVRHSVIGHHVRLVYRWRCIGEGRRPAGLITPRKKRCGASIAGTHLARAAWFEAASVHSFVRLARELRQHRAPAELQHAALVAASDEIRHARMMSELALARGATPPPVDVAPPRRRSIEALALENAEEGIVGETWAALIATWQAAKAPTAALRTTFAQIAIDETRHADLSRQVSAWAVTRLRRPARNRIAAARDAAIHRLERDLQHRPSRALVRELGMPGHTASQQLFRHAREQLWT